ncbi:MerR family transcriptional regulator [Bailinhaonella thermotolerans]|uniref:MerR family transcriptional regulator n=1 Tax=Bailinhaonella thermotolerans TaxID=1070861 RepID=UPI001F5BFC1F|nr:MerR family transcriptional regulator [Bailinhaonella thermotolerans]
MEWTIGELAERAVAALTSDDAPSIDNRRVRDLPNERLIRWYTSTGLLDPPARRGRVALYGPRHLLQLVAIKRLQAEGLSLTAIQARLAGATDATLTRAARLPAPPPSSARARRGTPPAPSPGAPPLDAPPIDAPPPSPAPPAPPPGTPSPLASPPPAPSGPSPAAPAARSPRYGGPRPESSVRCDDGSVTSPPAGPGEDGPAPGRLPGRESRHEDRPERAFWAEPPGLVHGVRLAPGLTLLLEAGRAPGEEDARAIAAAALPLIDELTRRGLLP